MLLIQVRTPTDNNIFCYTVMHISHCVPYDLQFTWKSVHLSLNSNVAFVFHALIKYTPSNVFEFCFFVVWVAMPTLHRDQYTSVYVDVHIVISSRYTLPHSNSFNLSSKISLCSSLTCRFTWVRHVRRHTSFAKH